MEAFLDPNLLATFFLLVGLELVLGIDNILLISIVSSRLPPEKQRKARLLGLSLALVMRVGMLFGVALLQKMTNPLLFDLSLRDLVLLAWGGFLLVKAVREIHVVVEHKHADENVAKKAGSLSEAVLQIVLLDAIFSIDSVITAVGLTENLSVIYSAVIVSFIVVLSFAGIVSDFVLNNPSMKILALSFLVCIGATLALEGMHHEVPKAYLYLPMGFALAVEFLELRYESKGKRKLE